MRLIDADEMAANESEAYMSAQTKIDSPITLAINSCVHRKIQKLIADTPTIDPEIPAADVATVRHGRWIPEVNVGDCCYRCSECQFLRDAYLLDIEKYCPNCGAKMNGGTN